MKKNKLDKEENKLLHSIEKGEWKSVKDLNTEIKKHQQYARNTLKKNKRINIRISSNDLEGIQTIAVEEGLPYQTLVASIIHKFVSGRFVESKKLKKTA